MDISRIRLIRPDVSVWLVYAGRGRRFFETFQESGAAFLNLPGFDASSQVFASDQLMRQHLAMSDAIYGWITGARNEPASRRAGSYEAYPYAGNSPDAKSFSAELGNIQRLFIEAKPGDLVLSPSYGHYEPYLIGEIIRPWRKDDDIVVRLLQDEVVPARPVNWLNIALAKRDFPARVSKKLQNQHAVSLIGEDYYKEIFDLVYPSYCWRDWSKLDIYGHDYRGRDPLQIVPSAELIKYVLASVFAFEAGEMDEFQALDPFVAIETYYDEVLVQEFGQNFNSPGLFKVIVGISSAAVLTAAGLFVATADHGAVFHHVQAAAVAAVHGALSGTHQAEHGEVLQNYVNSMSTVKWQAVQASLGEKSNETMSLSLNNAQQVAQHRGELNAR